MRKVSDGHGQLCLHPGVSRLQVRMRDQIQVVVVVEEGDGGFEVEHVNGGCGCLAP